MGLFGSKKKVEEAPVGGEAVLSDGTKIRIARRVDCLGVSCPRPQLMTKKAVGEIAVGDIIEVLADNPS
ncbi:MAG: sulfurtransferase TusA family protein, partial [Sulfuritalea sp.]|nr:sulfurtransferase TusA family protein [Sulfuritalea sp.]